MAGILNRGICPSQLSSPSAIVQPAFSPTYQFMLANACHYFYVIQPVTNPIALVNDTFEKPQREEISPCFPGNDKIVSNRSQKKLATWFRNLETCGTERGFFASSPYYLTAHIQDLRALLGDFKFDKSSFCKMSYKTGIMISRKGGIMINNNTTFETRHLPPDLRELVDTIISGVITLA